MNVARLFAMGVGVVFILVVLEGGRRQIMGLGLPRWKGVFIVAGAVFGLFVFNYGFLELLAGKGRRVGWLNGGVWMLIGLGINYIAIRELEQTEAWQKRVGEQKPLTRTGRLIQLLAIVFFILLMGIILLLSGRSDFSL